MEIELAEIRDFLGERPPFDRLPEAQLDAIPRSMHIRYLRRGSPFPPVGEEACAYVVRSGAIELRDQNGELHEKLAEGDIWPYECQLLPLDEQLHGAAAEDTLLYLLPCKRMRMLLRAAPDFGQHFTASLRERLKAAVRELHSEGSAASATTTVGALLRKAPVSVGPDCPIREFAQVMSEHNVSSVLVVEEGNLIGIVTDRDLRARCVAEGLPLDQPARAIMTTGLTTIDEKAGVMEALLEMTRRNIHHLPVTAEGRLIGMITATDLTRFQSTHAPYIARDITRAESLEELKQISGRLPELQLQLALAGSSAEAVGAAISHITDALTRRLIELAEQALGPAPVPYAWVAYGSQARREQTMHSDQDNSLIIDDAMRPADDQYFEALARFVNDGLDACGFVYCPGGIMAVNPKWRQPLRVWRGYFRDWIGHPEPKASMHATIFFDPRVVHGEAGLLEALRKDYLPRARANSIFIAYMVANALQNRPPLGFFRGFVMIRDGLNDQTLDIKQRGIIPITDLARVAALTEGLAPISTVERLRAAGQSGAISAPMAENLEDAFEFIASLRIRHQAEQVRRGEAPNNFLPPLQLSELERQHLKDAFRVIQQFQEILDARHQAARFR